MIKKILDWLFPGGKTVVNCDRQPYLNRWYLFRTEPFAIFLHQFVRSDEDRALEYWKHRQQRYNNRRPAWVSAAEQAIKRNDQSVAQSHDQ